MRLFFIILFLIVAVSADAYGAENSHFIDKYQGFAVVQSQVACLEKYHPLIEYFTSLSYLKPNHRVHPDFMRALIVAESACDPQARSPKDARGLTQILYSTGKEAAKTLAATGYPFRYVNHERLRNLAPRDLYDPAVNLLLASFLIAQYNVEFNGRLDLVVAAWNAGRGAIKNGQPPAYGETLDLIGKVNAYFVFLLQQSSQRPVALAR